MDVIMAEKYTDEEREYAGSAYALMGLAAPEEIGRALDVCAHWAVTSGKVATFAEWRKVRHPQQDHRFPAGTRYPDGPAGTD